LRGLQHGAEQPVRPSAGLIVPTGQIRPRPAARIAVALATRALPTVEDCDRYRSEFLADLHDLPTGLQLRYAAGVLSQTLALRAALGTDPRRIEEAGMTLQTSIWRAVRCHGLRLHYWKTYSTDDGSRYVACSVCKREHPGTGTFPGSSAAMG
jgi:hypothetical protein